MKKVVLICVLGFQFFLSPPAFSQNTVFNFLLIPTNAEMSGMGYASVAHITDNPAALTLNPSHLGMQCLDKNIASFGNNYCEWLPSFSPDIWIRTFVATAGVNLQKYYPKLPSMSVGLAYANTHFSYGRVVTTTTANPDGPGTPVDAYDESSQVTLSFAVDYYIRASLGLTYRHVLENFGDKISTDLYDVGFLLDAPLIPIISRIADKRITVADNLTPLCNFSVGISKTSLGNESIYFPASSLYEGAVRYPSLYNTFNLPRYARAGIEWMLGLQYEKNNISWIPFSFKWTVEANNSLVKTDAYGYLYSTDYKSGLGDIDFFKEVILGKTNKETEKLKGWEFGFGEAVSIYGGSFREDYYRGNRNFATSGYALRMSGMLKAIAIISPEVVESALMQYLLNHIDLKFNSSKIDLNNKKYYSFNVFWTNWGI